MEGERFRGGQQPQYSIFLPPDRGGNFQAVFQLPLSVQEKDLAALRLSALGNVEFCDDLEPGYNGAFEGVGDLVGDETFAVDPVPYDERAIFEWRLEMDVGSLLVVCVDQDLVDQLNDLRVRFDKQGFFGLIDNGRLGA